MERSKSFLRREEYKQLSQLSIDGSILDVGGSKKSGYHELIKGKHTFTVGNIDESYGLDVVFDAQEPWPFPDHSYNAVLFINLLEHLYNYETAISEARRVLHPEGRVVGVVPFMLNIHGTPGDYFRFTRFTLEKLLEEHGFSDIQVHELGTGAFSTVYQTLLGLVRWHWLADVLIPLTGGLDLVLRKLKPDNKLTAVYMPLGYYFEARSTGTDA